MTPNTETIFLLTKKIIDDLVSQFIEYKRVIDLDVNEWRETVFTSISLESTQITIIIKLDIFNNFHCEFSKITTRNIEVQMDGARMLEVFRERERLGHIGGFRLNMLNPVEYRQEITENISKTFNRKSDAINFISNNVNIDCLIEFGLKIKTSIENLNKMDAKHIGAIRKILGLNSETSLTSLQTRRILLEIYR